MRARYFIFFWAFFFLGLCALISIIGYGIWLVSASHATAHAGLAARSASQAEEKLLKAAVSPQLKLCPKSSGRILSASPQTGHHEVFLTWNARPDFPDPVRHRVGYCLYRSSTQNISAKDPKCISCEQVNQKPIPGTACVDGWVQDGAKYYYVATAVNIYGEPSVLSTDTPANIPPNSAATGATVTGTYPRCRAENVPQ
jgi:hypothetical protein